MNYKIFHIKVGSEKYWEEVKGFINCDGKSILLKSNKEGVHYDEYLLNTENHISPLAKKLGAKIYGGFEDEKDFYIALPIMDNYKVGDIFYYPEDRYKWLIMHDGYGFKTYDLQYVGVSIRNLKRYSFFNDLGEIIEKTNTFEEYARTGIIENDLYKHFF
jgi:hypothetical protein